MDAGYYEALEGLKRSASSQDDEEFFRQVAKSMIHWFESRPDLLRLKMFSALEGHEMVTEFNERTSRPFVDLIVSYIERRMADGAFQNLHPPTIAMAFCGMIAHHCMVTILFKAPLLPVATEQMVEHAVQILLHGIKN
jgi:AcrR family transcriptional regulator